MRSEDSYQRGERAYYEEDRNTLEVNILENKCDENKIMYELKFIRLVRGNFILRLRMGGTFTFFNAERIPLVSD